MTEFDSTYSHLHAWTSDPASPRDADGQLVPAVVAKAVPARAGSGVRQPTDAMQACGQDRAGLAAAAAHRCPTGDLNDWKMQYDNRHPGYFA